MATMMGQGMGGAPAPQGAPAGAQMPMPQGQGGEVGSNVSPEEQAQYDQFVNQAYKIIYSPESFVSVMNRMRAGIEIDPAESLATVTVMVVLRVQESARRNGVEIPGNVVFHAGVEILESLAETAQRAGLHEYTPEEIERAMLRAMDLYREGAEKLGMLHVESAREDVEFLKQAEQEGRLDEVLPGARERYGQQSAGQAVAPSPPDMQSGLVAPQRR